MNPRELLLAAVCENPDEDTPRLVFADWLQENGEEERAEFIRLQIAHAAVSEAERKPEDVAREKALLGSHQEEWVAPLKEFEGSRGDYYEFRRGFVEGVSSDGEALVEEGSRLFALAPIRAVYFADAEEYEELAECGWLLRLHTLDLKGSGLSRNFNPAPLLKSRYLANLTTLGLGGEDDNGHLDIHGIRALLESPHLGNLESLDLSGNWLNEAAFAHFLTATNLPSLRNLNLERVGIGDVGAVALAASSLARGFRELNVARNAIGDAGARALLESPRLAQLEFLELWDRRSAAAFFAPETVWLLQERFGDRVRL